MTYQLPDCHTYRTKSAERLYTEPQMLEAYAAGREHNHNEALTKDAERYRWLRTANNDSAVLYGDISNCELMMEEELDKAIDAAMAQGGVRDDIQRILEVSTRVLRLLRESVRAVLQRGLVARCGYLRSQCAEYISGRNPRTNHGNKMITTLNKIRACRPCSEGWTKLLSNLSKTKADDEPLAITTILDSNGLDDALWCLRAVDGHQSEMRLYAVDCARSVQHLITDPRSIAAIDCAERHAHGLATDVELAAASDAAWDAARAAAGDAAGGAAWDAARAARDAGDAAWGAARAAAWGAARAAAGDAAGDAAWGAARAAAREVQADLLRSVCAEIEQRDEK